MQKIKLWNGIEVPRIGMGCWAIGGALGNDGPATAYGSVNEADSRAGLNRAYEMGARFFDTAAAYGAGKSERLIGEEISHHEDAIIVTKFGYPVDDEKQIVIGEDVSPAAIRSTIDGSRRRLKRDKLDLALLHLNHYPIEKARVVFDVMEELVAAGTIAAYGWSDDNVSSIEEFIDRPNFVAIENDLNLFTPATEMMKLAENKGFVSINRLPLAMGLLSGKFSAKDKLAKNDVRAQDFDWLRFFKDGQPNPEYLGKLDALKDLLTFGDRSVVQGSLSWILVHSPQALPVPGFKNAKQAEENFSTASMQPLPDHIMTEIEKILGSFQAETNEEPMT